MPSLPQEVLIEKASKWQGRFRGDTASFNKEVTNEGVCLGLGVWRLYCTLTGKYKEYEKILKLIYNSDPLAEHISPEVHQAYETFIQNTLWLHRTLRIEVGTQQDRMEGALEALFEREGEPFPLTYHQQFAGIITVEELKETLVTYLALDPNKQQGVGFTLSCNKHSISITRVGNQIEVIDPAYGESWIIEIPQKETAEENTAALKSAVSKMFDEAIYNALHFDEANFQGTYTGIRMHVYSRLRDPNPEILPTIYPSTTELVTSIYEKRKNTLEQQDNFTKLDALAYAVQNGDKKLVEYLEGTLGAVKLEACKKQAFKSAVSYGQLEFVIRYYKKEYVDQNVLINAFASGDKQVINFLLEKGHRFEKKAFDHALTHAARLDQGYIFNLLLEYYDKFYKEQSDLVNPAELIYSGTLHKIRTPLLNIAAQNNSVEVIHILLTRKVNLSLTDESGRNCLHYLTLHQPELFVDIVSRNPALLLAKDKQGERPIHRLYQTEGKLNEKIYPILIKEGRWYEVYILALKNNNQSMIKRCQENITFAAMLQHEGGAPKNRFVELCETAKFDDGRMPPFIQALAGINYTEQTQETLHSIYLLALKQSNVEIINSVLQVAALDPNVLFKAGGVVDLSPWKMLTQKPELFELILKKVDIKKLGQEQLIEYYLVALQHTKIDLCKEIGAQILDKNALLLKSPRSQTDPFIFFEKDDAAFNQLISPIALDDLKSAALNQMYVLGLLHNNQDVYGKCIKKLKEDPLFLARTDDLELCSQRNSNTLFKELFSIKNVSEEWCKKIFIKSLHEKNYEIADVVLKKFPQLVNAQIDNINGVPQYPLWVAIHQKNTDRCQFLLAHNADPYVKRLSSTLMQEGQRHGGPLKKLFESYDINIKIMQNQFSDILEQLKEYKKWKLTKKYGLFGDYIDTIVLKIGDKSVRFPKELREVLDILCKANKETSVSLLKEQTYKLAERIHSIPDKVLSSSFKLKLIETINSSNPKFVAVAPAQFAPDPFLLADLIPSQEESLLQTKIR
ncbi:ankyrin repeat domain-containing protein [Legionella tucsonensis]|uniref:Ankyrin repeats (3 copies) n=1 Tax=Legionella tucsonensis TaxID=40335 RepID=A0A0W0ZVC3_9GAMM|nr:ankyrin repeat domain-containing protein [Legionella tucsonensis]KTD73074.1 Ankyrin repeats (3 copies) [Legionella tucsonensis]